MKKIILVIVLLFSFPNFSEACTNYETAKNTPSVCTYNELKSLLKKYRKQINKFGKRANMFADLMPDYDYTHTKYSYKDVKSVLKKRIKEKKQYIERRCDQLAARANNSWSASKMYRICVKEQITK